MTAAVLAGVRGLEVVSWVAGIGSFLIAVWTWYSTGDSEQAPPPGDVTQTAAATDDATINQAGGDIELR